MMETSEFKKRLAEDYLQEVDEKLADQMAKKEKKSQCSQCKRVLSPSWPSSICNICAQIEVLKEEVEKIEAQGEL